MGLEKSSDYAGFGYPLVKDLAPTVKSSQVKDMMQLSSAGNLVACSATKGVFSENIENCLKSLEAHNRLMKFEKMVWQAFGCTFGSRS